MRWRRLGITFSLAKAASTQLGSELSHYRCVVIQQDYLSKRMQIFLFGRAGLLQPRREHTSSDS